jgi:hypothetical protein
MKMGMLMLAVSIKLADGGALRLVSHSQIKQGHVARAAAFCIANSGPGLGPSVGPTYFALLII